MYYECLSISEIIENLREFDIDPRVIRQSFVARQWEPGFELRSWSGSCKVLSRRFGVAIIHERDWFNLHIIHRQEDWNIPKSDNGIASSLLCISRQYVNVMNEISLYVIFGSWTAFLFIYLLIPVIICYCEGMYD